MRIGPRPPRLVTCYKSDIENRALIEVILHVSRQKEYNIIGSSGHEAIAVNLRVVRPGGHGQCSQWVRRPHERNLADVIELGDVFARRQGQDIDPIVT